MDACAGDLRVFPFEVLLCILDHLPPADRISLRLTNKYLWHMNKKDGAWDDNFSSNRRPEDGWWPPSNPPMQWRPPVDERGMGQLLARLARDAPGLMHVCPNCEVLHSGPYARSSLYEVRYNSTQGFSDLFQGRGLCAASGSSDWEVRDLFLDGSRSSFPVAQKCDFHTGLLFGAQSFACHRVIRVLMPASVVLALPAASQPVVLALWTCPFVICSHFALRFLNTTRVPMTDVHDTIYGDDDNPRSHLDTGRGWVLPWDPCNTQAVPSGFVERGRWFECSGCEATYGVSAHFHGDRGVEVVLDVFHKYARHEDWRNTWEPTFAMPESGRPHQACFMDHLIFWGWRFCAPLLVPGASGISDPSFDAAERALRERYSSRVFSLEE